MTEKVLQEIITEIFSNLATETNLIQKAEKIPNKRNTTKHTARRFIIKLLKTEEKHSLQATRAKSHFTL
jgi:hypothetical protein